MLEPQSTVFFVLLVVVFIGVLWWMLVTGHLALRILAAVLAFASAMMFGVAAVNKYYGYYQTWGAAIADLTSQGTPGAQVSTMASGPSTRFSAAISHIDLSIARQYGLTVHLRVHGKYSHISRMVYVFLPSQYFRPGFYQNYRFPVIELIHGFPGQPQDWITVLGVNSILDSLISQHRARPAVLVMPDANGGRGISLQCLNQRHGPPDDLYLSRDVPAYISGMIRVQKPGTGWGIAGYSEGGFCAANLALRHGKVYNFAGVMSGYFRPSDNQLPKRVSPFGTNRRRSRNNTPVDLLGSLPLGRPIPQFWLGAGLQDAADVSSARAFAQLVQLRQPAVALKLVPGGGHTMVTWRKLLPSMLSWMTRGLAREVAYYDSPAAQRRRAAEAAAKAAQQLRKLERREGHKAKRKAAGHPLKTHARLPARTPFVATHRKAP